MTEAIKDPEDRNFDSSIGHWAGDATWHPGPIFGYTGLIHFPLTPLGPNKSISLGYPNLKIPENAITVFDILTGTDLIVWGYPFFTFLITDGIGTDLIYNTPYYPIPTWQHFAWPFTPPPEWNKETGTVIITLHTPDQAEGGIYIHTASMLYESPKIQYLPLMGIG